MTNKRKKTRNIKRKHKKGKTIKRTQRTFTNADYKSGDGMLTSVWGPGLWHYLHTMSFNYPINPTQIEKKQYRDFILSLEHVLPCKYCRINLKKNFKNLPLTMSSMKNRETFSRYIFNLHEHVNKMLGKKSGLSYKEVRERYEHFRARCTDTNKTLIIKKSGKNEKEKGCVTPLYGKKSKCVIKIVPHDKKCETFQIDNKCIKLH